MAKYEITVDGDRYVVEVGDISGSPVTVVVNGKLRTVEFARMAETAKTPVKPQAPRPSSPEPPRTTAAPPEPAPAPPANVAPGGDVVRAPMPGKIMTVPVHLGDSVLAGATVCTLEAMKMEMPIGATSSGTVQAINVVVGDTVGHNDPLVTIGSGG